MSSINQVIIYIMVVCMALGAIDKCLGNKFGIGEKFEEGIMAMGSLALAMVGVICLAPVLANVLGPIVTPVFNALGADPAMFAGSILANDMGGAPLAASLAQDPQAGMFSGLIIAFSAFIKPIAIKIANIIIGTKFLRIIIAGNPATNPPTKAPTGIVIIPAKIPVAKNL